MNYPDPWFPMCPREVSPDLEDALLTLLRAATAEDLADCGTMFDISDIGHKSLTHLPVFSG